jgi:hypothetical protein
MVSRRVSSILENGISGSWSEVGPADRDVGARLLHEPSKNDVGRNGEPLPNLCRRVVRKTVNVAKTLVSRYFLGCNALVGEHLSCDDEFSFSWAGNVVS